MGRVMRSTLVGLFPAVFLACGGLMPPSPTEIVLVDVAEPDGKGEEEPIDVQQDWQRAYASASPTVRDLYMLLPNSAFVCDEPGDVADGPKDREARITASGEDWLEARGSTGQLELKRYGDVVALSLRCGMGCMCNMAQLRTWTGTGWSVDEGLDARLSAWEIDDEGSEEGRFLDLPRDGDVVQIVDQDGAPLAEATVSDGVLIQLP